MQPQPRDLVTHPSEIPQRFAGVLEHPVKLGLLVGVRREAGTVSLSPRGAEFPSCGLHTAGTYQSDSLKKGSLFIGEKTVASESTHCSSSVNPCRIAAVDSCISAVAGGGHVSPLAPWHCSASHDHHRLYAFYFS